MAKYLLNRIMQTIALLLIVSLLSFFLVSLMPPVIPSTRSSAPTSRRKNIRSPLSVWGWISPSSCVI